METKKMDFADLYVDQRRVMLNIERALPNYKKLGRAKMTLATTQWRVEQLKLAAQKLDELDGALQRAATEEIQAAHSYFRKSQHDAATEAYHEAMDYMHEILLELSLSVQPATNNGAVSRNRARSFLPQAELPRFDGSYASWETFRDRFTSLVINDSSLSDVDRLHFLVSVVSGEAGAAIQHLKLVDANFDIAWRLLCEQYENTRRLIATHFHTLHSLPPVRPDSAADLKALRARAKEAIHGLRELQRPVDAWEDPIVDFVVRRFDHETHRLWETQLGDGKNCPRYAEVDHFLAARARVIEATPLLKRDAPETRVVARPRRLATHNATVSGRDSVATCPLCKGASHALYKCERFAQYSPQRRRETVQQLRRCYNCLSAGHSRGNCGSERRCRVCAQTHHTMLHVANSANTERESHAQEVLPVEKSSTGSVKASTHLTCNAVIPLGTVLLATARVRITTQQGRSLLDRALLDPGSTVSLVTERVAQTLRLPRVRQSAQVRGVGGVRASSSSSVHFRVGPADRDGPSYETEALVMRSLSPYLPPRTEEFASWQHVQGLKLADPDPLGHEPIDLLIGSDVYEDLLRRGRRRGRPGTPTARATVFGWVLSGPLKVNSPTLRVTSHSCVLSEECDQALRRFWEIEELPDESALTPEEQRCEQHFSKTYSRDANGRYVVRLPFRAPPAELLGESRTIALRRFHRLEQSLAREPTTRRAYSEFVEEYERLGHLKCVPRRDSPTTGYYIPHHAVYREGSATTALRVVFDASSRSTSGHSLNDCLCVGPKLQTDLAAVLLQWRQHRFVLTADVEKMFRQIRVDTRVQPYQRILWRPQAASAIREYQLCTVTYGLNCAPYLANRVLRQLAIDEGERFPAALPVLSTQLYVDDFAFGADDVTSARHLRDQLTALLATAGFRLRKWASNNTALLADIDASDHGLAQDLNVSGDATMRVLGISWQPAADSFRCRVLTPVPSGHTKRSVLSTIARMYDPLGFAAPVVCQAKIVMQRLWSLKCEWDAVLPPCIDAEWQQFCAQLPALQELVIPRWTGLERQGETFTLHGFADASTRAYAAVAYARVRRRDGSAGVTLLAAKTRVAPLQTISVPRLELCAALLLSRLVNFIRASVDIPSARVFCWTDSSIVESWLAKPPATLETFVANRVTKIHRLTQGVSWRHVPTKENPADCASRGLTPLEFLSHPLWLTGPSWLSREPGLWPAPLTVTPTTIELGNDSTFTHHVVFESETWDLPTRYSSWSRLLRVTALVMRFVRRARRLESPAASDPTRSPNAPQLLPCDLQEAKEHWLRRVQAEAFPQELRLLRRGRSVSRSIPLHSLVPFLDTHGLVRVTGRLARAHFPANTQHPVVLKAHPLVTLLVTGLHLNLLHAGPRLTLATLRRDYWLLRARATVRAILHSCVSCAREQATVANPFMGELPPFRVQRPPRAFTHTGVDYAGPVEVRVGTARSRTTSKAYIAVFVCMSVKAVHLEAVTDYTSAAFLAAYHRFTARRGLPSVLYADNGTTFHGAEREMTRAYRDATRHSDFVNRVATDGVRWRFIPPAAPHFGGLWEATVRSVKHHLRRCVGASTLSYEALSTMLCRIEACLNSRPLVASTDSPDDYTALTPGHFLIGAPLVAPPEISVLDLNEHRLSRWQQIQRSTETFWRAWSSDYVLTLQQRPCWRTRGHLTTTGQMVLLRETAQGTRPAPQAYTTIYQGIERQFQTLIADTLDGKEAWKILKTNFEPTSRARVAGLIDAFYELKFNKNEETIGIFCRRVKEKSTQIKEAGFELPEMLTCFQLIRKLPEEYDNLVRLLYRFEEKEFNFNNVERQLINEDGRIQQKRKDEGFDVTLDAYQTGTNREHREFRSQNSNMNNHRAHSGNNMDFRERQTIPQRENQRNKICNFCKKPGHVIKDCYSLKRKNQNRGDNNPRWNSNHQGKAFYIESPETLINKTPFEAQVVNSNNNDHEEWLIDSAATSHFCKERDWFENFQKLPPTDVLIGDKNAKSQVLGKGDIIFHVKDRNGYNKIKLLNVLYAPNMRRNLISGANMDIAGFKINWRNSKMIIHTEDDDYLFTVHRKDKLYIVYGIPDIRKQEIHAVHQRSKHPMELIHRRFCHLNANSIIHMSKKNIVNGIQEIENRIDTCNTCRLTKATRASFKPIGYIKSKGTLERV